MLNSREERTQVDMGSYLDLEEEKKNEQIYISIFILTKQKRDTT
jgi:hypothetical protein